MKQKLTPPQGYASWLDYAVATIDARSVCLENLLTEPAFSGALFLSPDDVRNAAREELHALRALAKQA
jgi:hypothetical protein